MTLTPATLYTRIDAGLGEAEADGSCVDGVNVWSVLLRMRMKREGFGESICAAVLISLSVC
jgi:hypothetical protein